MEKKNLRYSINASAISRYANRNFDLCLRHLPISSGQQFFLLRIYENPGIPLNGLAQLGFFAPSAAVCKSWRKPATSSLSPTKTTDDAGNYSSPQPLHPSSKRC